MELIYIYALCGFGAGIIITWIILTFNILKLKKLNKSLQGYLESEKLRKETLLRENTSLHDLRKSESDASLEKITILEANLQRMDEDILLLQKNNEETEALLEAGLPVVHSLKLQLIEANNTIARYKANLDRKVINDELT